MVHALFLSVLIAAGSAGAAQAQENPEQARERLESVQKSLAEREAERKTQEKAQRAAEAEARKLAHDMVAAAAEIRQTEANAARIEDRIADLEAAAADKRQTLETHRDELLGLLAALERLSKRPVAFTFLQPQEALQTARSASLMSTLVPRINARAETLKTELAGLTQIQLELTAERSSLKNTLTLLTERQEKLAYLLDKRKADARQAGEAARQASSEMAKFAQEARSLRELIDKLERQAAKERERAEAAAKLAKAKPLPKPVTPGGRPMGQARGNLPYPAIGAIVQGFGVKEAMGTTRGIRIKARPGAQVVAPYDGQIVFAGPFLGYGQMVIIAHGDGYHSLLAGLDEMYGVVGQWVLTGEPVGAMNKKNDVAELYMELRHKGNAIDPAPWLSRRTAAAQ